MCILYKSLSYPKDIMYSQGFDSFKFWLFTFRYWVLWNSFLYVGWGRDLILIYSLRKNCCFITVTDRFPTTSLRYCCHTKFPHVRQLLTLFLTSICPSLLCAHYYSFIVNLNAWEGKFSSTCSPKFSWFCMPFCSSN